MSGSSFYKSGTFLPKITAWRRSVYDRSARVHGHELAPRPGAGQHGLMHLMLDDLGQLVKMAQRDRGLRWFGWLGRVLGQATDRFEGRTDFSYVGTGGARMLRQLSLLLITK